MKIDPEIAAFILAAKQAEQEGIFTDLDTEQLEKLKYEIAEDPDLTQALKDLFNNT